MRRDVGGHPGGIIGAKSAEGRLTSYSLRAVRACGVADGSFRYFESSLESIMSEVDLKLNPQMLYRQVQYLVDEGDWLQQGEEISLSQ